MAPIIREWCGVGLMWLVCTSFFVGGPKIHPYHLISVSLLEEEFDLGDNEHSYTWTNYMLIICNFFFLIC